MKNRMLCGDALVLEESYDSSKGEAIVTVIKPGFNVSKSRYYPATMLKRDFKVFEGAKMFTDHQTEAESKAKPEGSVNRWVANITKVWAEEDGRIRASVAVIDPSFKEKLDMLASKKMLPQMGVSIRAIGEATAQKVEGHQTNYVESLIKARSVDFVTYAGAGGQVEAIESAVEGDLDLMTEAQLRDRRPDLVALIESNKEQQTMTEQQFQEALAAEKAKVAAEEAKTAAAVAENTQLKSQMEESAKTARRATAKAELDKQLSESKLPEPAQVKIRAQFAEAEKSDGFKEAIEAEKAYIKSVTTGKGVTNMGTANESEEEHQADKVNLVESFMSLGMTEDEAKIAAKGKR